jgi:hypothetical protein
MRALVALTVFMGVLILAGLAVIVVTIVHRLSAPKQAVPIEAGLPEYTRIAVPNGAAIGGMVPVGDRLVLHLVTPDARDRLITLDPTTGTVLQTIDLVRDPPAEKP